MKHIHETWAFLVKSGILRTSVYNVYGSQNEFVERITRGFILRMCSLGLNINGPLRRKTVFAVARIMIPWCLLWRSMLTLILTPTLTLTLILILTCTKYPVMTNTLLNVLNFLLWECGVLARAIRCWSPNVTRSVVMVSWFMRNYCACTLMLYISELCKDCAVANEIDYEIDYAWASIHDNGHVITACDVWLQQRIVAGTNVISPQSHVQCTCM